VWVQGHQRWGYRFRIGASIPGASSISSGPSLDNLLQDQTCLKEELSEVKQALTEEKALNAKRHEDLLNAISALTVKFFTPP